ncbi:putative ABC transport system permease protein [Catalinimonas alkaloidigena]|uniref:Putative ABC transport system permease protein n=1 Tax=Catalinimonas alkaloidigena TaxID=1075417 RepID=A0A1G8YH18_9BACT|nr:ABC transporter permease [Catalinimonas alkaloidigena]SDK01505.1 putative ABC transport system permease protein [Catalinimonas alkaloidigena]
MLQNYFTLALRNFAKQKGYFLLNVVGLSIGLAVAVLILLYIGQEQAYDRHLPHQERIFRVYRQWGDKAGGTVFTPFLVAPTLPERLPDVQKAAWVMGYGEVLLAHEEKSLYVEGVAMVDTNWLDVMPLTLQAGNPQTALHQPYAAVISADLAHRFFGDAPNPVGQLLRFNGEHDYTVTGVLAPAEGPTHLTHEAYLTDPEFYGDNWQHWTGNNAATYVALQPGADPKAAEQKITELCNGFIAKEYQSISMQYGEDDFPTWRLQPVADIHLHSAQLREPEPSTGDARNLYIFGLVAGVVLLIAGINYMNLATAQAARRAREVGVRKVTGATKEQLLTQFLVEAVGQTLVALPLAWLLAEAALPLFNQVTDRAFTLGWAALVHLLPWMLALVLVVGVGAGLYPAFFLAAYRPADVLKGGKQARRSASGTLRKGLVVAQFTLAIVLAVVMTFIYRQVRFMQDQELGFQASQLLVVPLNSEEGLQRIQSLRSELLRIPHVEQVTTTSTVPGQPHADYTMDIAGREGHINANIYFTDTEFASTLGLYVQEGRYFSADHPSDTGNAFVVNEAFVQEHQLANPVGHGLKFVGDDQFGTIIGVVKDFHYRGLDRKIQPLVFSAKPWQYQVVMKVAAQDLRTTLASVEGFWRQIEPAHPMRYSFLDDDFAALYGEQERFGQTLLYATLLTLFVAALGMFGLASFLAAQRTKEIGVRKVLGASVPELVVMLGKDFLKLVGIASLVAAPLAYWLAQQWLADFAYRTRLSAVPFLLVGGAALLIAALTVSYHSLRAAHANPVESLRSE